MGVPIGRLFGTDIRATGGFLLLLAFAFYLNGAEYLARSALFCIVIVVSLLVHEFGHVFAVRRQLGSESVVILWGLGGLCVHEPARTPRQRIIISLMGPAFSAALAGLALAASRFAPLPDGQLAEFVRLVLWVNTLWLAFNLLPIRPMDGGQALEAALSIRLGTGRALLATRRISVLVAAIAAVAAYVLGLRFAAILSVMLLIQNLMPGE